MIISHVHSGLPGSAPVRNGPFSLCDSLYYKSNFQTFYDTSNLETTAASSCLRIHDTLTNLPVSPLRNARNQGVKVVYLINNKKLGGGFKHFLFLSLPGEMIQFD